MRFSKPISILLFLLLLSFGFSLNVGINISPTEDLTYSQVSVFLNLKSAQMGYLSILVDGEIEGLNVLSIAPISIYSSYHQGVTKILVGNPLIYDYNNSSVKVTFYKKNTISDSGSSLDLVISFSQYADVDVRFSGSPYSNPVQWSIKGLKPNKQLHISSKYVSNSVFPSVDILDFSTILYLFLAVMAIFLFYWLYFRKFSRKSSDSEEKTVPSPSATSNRLDIEGSSTFPLLTDREKEVVKVLASLNCRASQKQIFSKATLSKATLSRALSGLESKGVVERFKRGNTNLVVLNIEMFKNKKEN